VAAAAGVGVAVAVFPAGLDGAAALPHAAAARVMPVIRVRVIIRRRRAVVALMGVLQAALRSTDTASSGIAVIPRDAQ
jgi:hypothetical protein